MFLKSVFVIFLFTFWTCANAKGKVSDWEYSLMPPIFELDDYDRCMVYKEKALYCSAKIQLAPTDVNNVSDIWKTIETLKENPKNYRHDWLRHGICIPLSCPFINTSLTETDEELWEGISQCISDKYRHLGLQGSVIKLHCETTEPYYKIDFYDIVVGVLLIAYVLFVIYASFYEGTARYKTQEEYEKITGTPYGRFIASFSIPKNYYRLTATSDSPDAKALSCIQGIRFFNMVCVILAHTVMSILAGPIANTKYVESMTDDPLNMFIVNGGSIVQTFFVISGWLLAYYFFVTFEGKKGVKFSYIIMAFINRYIRLTPTLLVMVAVHSTWLVHMGRGPVWDNIVGEEYRYCRKNWWTNLLYINNYYDPHNMCLQQTWYLASDMQLFILSLLILMLIKQYEYFTKAILGVSIGIGILIPGVINYVLDYDILVRQYAEPLYRFTLDIEQWHIMFSSGYTNMGGYFMGLAFGCLFYKYRGKNIIGKHWAYIALFWILKIGLIVGTLLSAGAMYKDDFTYTRFWAAVYVALNRNIFAFGVGLLMFGYSQGEGWCFRSFCEWKQVRVLGRITFSAYLIHLCFQKAKVSSYRHPKYISDYIIFIELLSDLAVSYMAAFVLSLLVELPVSALQKYYVPKGEQKKIKDDISQKSINIMTHLNDISQNESKL